MEMRTKMSGKLARGVYILLFAQLAVGQAGGQIKELVTVAVTIDTITLKGVDQSLLHDFRNIRFGHDDAIKYLQRKYRAENWKDQKDPFREYINMLLFYSTHSRERDVVDYLSAYPYDSLKIPSGNFYVWDTIRIKIPSGPERDSLLPGVIEKALAVKDTTRGEERYDRSRIIASLGNNLLLQGDTLLLVMADTLDEVTSSAVSFPFRRYLYPFTGDSIQAAIYQLTASLQGRDSATLMLTGTASNETPFVLNSAQGQLVRFWLRNEYDDSVTVWVGSPEYNTIGLYLENNIMFRRPVRANSIGDANVNAPAVDNRKLMQVQTVYVKPDYWRFTSELSSVLNQAYLTNWVKGGESNISSVFDFTFNANYLNTPKKLMLYNQARVKHGFIWSRDNGLRRNADLVEVNSKLNYKAFGKFDFSGTALFKTQLAKGFSYPKDKDPVLVSRILSPATFTVGLGLDYKPNKETSFNVAPLSYKGTYVMDTVTIDQKKYGIPVDRKARHEPGASVLINHKFKLLENINISNRVQLFTNYIEKPQNVDIDWELIATMSLNWFTDVRLNTHFIYDDDTKTVMYDDGGNPVLGSDGKPVKTARIQFKEVIGFSFIFRF